MTKEVTDAPINEGTLTKEIKEAIDDIKKQKKAINETKEILKEFLEAVAEKLGTKAGVLNRRIDLIMKEEEKGGEVESKSADILFVENYFNN